MRKPENGADQTRIHKALLYINDIDLFLDEADTAIEVLMAVFPGADTDLKDEIIFLLGSLDQPEIGMWLYTILADPDQAPPTRRNAALQLSLTAATLESTDELRARLLADMDHPDAVRRHLAVLAMGWEGNQCSANDISRLTNDADGLVRQAAAAALAHITQNPLHPNVKEDASGKSG